MGEWDPLSFHPTDRHTGRVSDPPPLVSPAYGDVGGVEEGREVDGDGPEGPWVREEGEELAPSTFSSPRFNSNISKGTYINLYSSSKSLVPDDEEIRSNSCGVDDDSIVSRLITLFNISLET